LTGRRPGDDRQRRFHPRHGRHRAPVCPAPGQRLAVVMFLYLLFLLLPIYWLINMSFKTNAEIVSDFTLIPRDPTLQNYITIFTDRPGIRATSTR
jgi:ABC-type glycerol-3-phosphate transport system permease component